MNKQDLINLLELMSLWEGMVMSAGRSVAHPQVQDLKIKLEQEILK